jgi:SNF2 family DNA or RNA helicase
MALKRPPLYHRGLPVFKGTLYPYQQESVDKMIDRGQVLLGLVMGAGKTVTTIAAIERLIELDEVERCLIVVPASLKYQWMREIKKFTDSSVMVIDGTPKQREQQWKKSLSTRYTIVNPESLIRDGNSYKHLAWQSIVIDEATMLKSRSSKRSKMLKRLAKPIYYRYALTGQPIENRPEELFSIMEFVDASILGRFDLFDKTFIIRDHFGRPKRYKNLGALHESLKECMIRKTREDIADQLPKIIHQVIPVPFDSKGSDVYNRISQDLLHQLSTVMNKHGAAFNLWRHYNDKESNEAQGQVMARLTALRMLCDNPELVIRSAAIFEDPSRPDEGSQYASDIVKAGLLSGTTQSPKLDAVMDYITEVLDEHPNNKVVLFSFFKENLRLIQKRTQTITRSVLFMGGMSAQERDDAKQQFATDPNTRLFLSSDAGGYGVDLPMANYLISYDLPWSSGKLEQREARIIRLSSQFPHVTIATFVMKGSIEERQYEMLQQKKSINEAFVDGKHHDVRGGFDITLGSLSNFLRESAV